MQTDRARMIGLLTGIALELLVVAITVRRGQALEPSIHLTLKVTARISFLIWLSTFAASPMARLGPRRVGRGLLAWRSVLGVTFAGAHLVHLSVLVSLLLLFPETRVPGFIKIFGSIGVTVLTMMTITSFKKGRPLAGTHWRQLHSLGTWYFAILFGYGLVIHPVVRGHLAWPSYYPFTALLLLTLVARIRLTSLAGSQPVAGAPRA